MHSYIYPSACRRGRTWEPATNAVLRSTAPSSSFRLRLADFDQSRRSGLHPAHCLKRPHGCNNHYPAVDTDSARGTGRDGQIHRPRSSQSARGGRPGQAGLGIIVPSGRPKHLIPARRRSHAPQRGGHPDSLQGVPTIPPARHHLLGGRTRRTALPQRLWHAELYVDDTYAYPTSTCHSVRRLVG